MVSYDILFAAWVVSLFGFERFGLALSLGFLYVASNVDQWEEFGALAVVGVAYGVYKSLIKVVES